MKSLVLYGSPTKLTNAHKPVNHVGPAFPGQGAECQPRYFVRIKVFPGDIGQAMLKAKPLKGEILLNTVEYPELTP